MASDQRMVGHAIRRRQGSAASHLGQAEGAAKRGGTWSPPSGGLSAAESIARQEEDVVRGGGVQAANRPKGVPATYETGTATAGPRTSARNVLSSDPWAFASGVSSAREMEPHPPRPKAPQAEAAGARLTVSPSMKIPTESPVPTQGSGVTVPSSPSRRGSFGAGMQEAGAG